MASEPRLTQPTLLILREFVNDPTTTLTGADLVKSTGLLSGTIYPILLRLEKHGWFQSSWEDVDPKVEGRPRKRFYQLTALGERSAKRALNELRIPEWRLAWNS